MRGEDVPSVAGAMPKHSRLFGVTLCLSADATRHSALKIPGLLNPAADANRHK